jgi:hypothetical protein
MAETRQEWIKRFITWLEEENMLEHGDYEELYLVAGAKFGRAMTTLVESQRVRTSMIISWTSHS